MELQWLVDLFVKDSVAHILIILSLVIGLGLAIGHFKVCKVGLGVAGVLFSGLLFSHFGLTIHNPEILNFVREFGLILFVYSIGLQVGPSFLNVLYRQGIRLNVMAAAIVLMGVLVTVLIANFAQVPLPIAVGLFSGGTTNTPSLAAAQQSLLSLPNASPDIANLAATGYAIAYPFGILGIIITMLLIQFGLKINPEQEAKQFEEEQSGKCDLPAYEDLDVQNPNLDGVALSDIHFFQPMGFLVTRVMQGKHIHVAKPDTVIRLGDSIRVVGPQEKMPDMRLLIGSSSEHNLSDENSLVVTRKIIVTKRDYLRKSVEQLQQIYQVVISRIARSTDVEFIPYPGFRIQLGDQLTVVGSEENIERLSKAIGNSLEQLNIPEVLSIFIGITLGVILGSLPIAIPGASAPIKLGLAGGPLIAALILSAKGSIGPISWHLPKSANLMLREIGIVLFLAAVGLNAGHKFFHSLSEGDGFYWMGLAVFITLTPLIITGLVARLVFKLNFMSLCGLLSGSMTDPPALAFANAIANSNAPSLSYATVYPLVMILRIISAQLIVQFWYS
jgi:putative transport protein